MIEFRQGNLLEADADALVNTVNCVGVMGKGIALQFKLAYPDNFREYERACNRGEVRLGSMLVHTTGSLTPPRFIINFPTKQHWKGKSRLEDIRAGLADLVRVIRNRQITSIAVPPLGCGNGGLNWGDVFPMIEQAVADMPDVSVFVYAPQPAPSADAMPVATKRPKMTRGRALLVKLIARYREPGYRLTKLEVQKLAYFLQAAGEQLRLRFVKHTFGPYAENLNHALRDMEGHLIRGFGDRTADSSIHPLPGAVEEADDFLKGDLEAQTRLERVAELITGFENPYGMELLSTIHWVAVENEPVRTDAAEATHAVHSWNERKKNTFRPEHIVKGWARLKQAEWMPKSVD
jgi:O-acetyl-ADP-ribose deacetylase (regulator of RNase III)